MAQPFKSPTGIYQLRRKVPPELRSALGHEYKRSLKTRDPSEAKTRFAEEWARSDDAFALARAQSEGLDALGERDIQQLAARWFRTEAQKLEASGNFVDWLFEAETWINELGDQYVEHTRLPSSAASSLSSGSPITALAQMPGHGPCIRWTLRSLKSCRCLTRWCATTAVRSRPISCLRVRAPVAWCSCTPRATTTR
ncbi:DUF6538 domain-containing protein [Variovorax sp. YR634]|uniref:DUF6538 domain-containing protein n=1 Tax=Variovorax TaxID=34072 RepID=UPI003523BEF0